MNTKNAYEGKQSMISSTLNTKVARAGIAAGVICIMLLAVPRLGVSEELRYEPVNPAFGGNPFNGPYLLSNATTQRQQSAPKPERPSAVEEFSENIQRNLLSQISRNIADTILGEDAKESGHFVVGDSVIDFHRDGGKVVVDVQDQATGAQTTIELPVPSY